MDIDKIYEGIIIGGIGGFIGGLSIWIINFLREKITKYNHKRRIYNWLYKETEYTKDATIGSPGDRWRTTRDIASHVNLTVNRVNYICSNHNRITRILKEDLWTDEHLPRELSEEKWAIKEFIAREYSEKFIKKIIAKFYDMINRTKKMFNLKNKNIAIIIMIIGIMLFAIFKKYISFEIGISLISLFLAILAFMPGILQKRSDLIIRFGDLKKIKKLTIGVKSDISLQICNDGNTLLIDEIIVCIPIPQFKDIGTSRLREDEFGRPLILSDFRLDICGIGYIALIFPCYGSAIAKGVCKPFPIFTTPEIIGTHKIYIVINAQLDINSMKFPFKYMVNVPERIREELIIEIINNEKS